MRLVSLLIATVLIVPLVGCKPDNEPIERSVKMIVDNVVTPSLGKAIAETHTTSAQLQGGAEVINPGYEGNFEGFWVTGLMGKINVRAVGVAGRISGSTQAAHEPQSNSSLTGEPEALQSADNKNPTTAPSN